MIILITNMDKTFERLGDTAREDVYIEADIDTRILYVNRNVEAMFGYTPEELTREGELVEILVAEQYREAHRTAVQRAKETGEARLVGTCIPALRAVDKWGREFKIELFLSKLDFPDGSWTYGGIIHKPKKSYAKFFASALVAILCLVLIGGFALLSKIRANSTLIAQQNKLVRSELQTKEDTLSGSADKIREVIEKIKFTQFAKTPELGTVPIDLEHIQKDLEEVLRKIDASQFDKAKRGNTN